VDRCRARGGCHADHATELWTSAAQWFFQTDLPPAAHRGAYVGTGHMVVQASRMLAPAGLTLLAISIGGWGWWVIAAIFVACVFLARPAVDWVARTPRVGEVAPVPRPAVVA
jgi:hypothetical protein